MKKIPAPESPPQTPKKVEETIPHGNVVHHHQILDMEYVVKSMEEATRAQVDIAASVRLLLENKDKSASDDGDIHVKIIRDYNGNMSELILIRRRG